MTSPFLFLSFLFSLFPLPLFPAVAGEIIYIHNHLFKLRSLYGLQEVRRRAEPSPSHSWRAISHRSSCWHWDTRDQSSLISTLIPPAGLAAVDPLTGWNVLAPNSPFAASPEAFMPFARRGTTLCYHTQANVSVTMNFLNWAKGSVLLNIDLAVTAEWLRMRENTQMPWAERKARFQWLAVAADNLAVARLPLRPGLLMRIDTQHGAASLPGTSR